MRALGCSVASDPLDEANPEVVKKLAEEIRLTTEALQRWRREDEQRLNGHRQKMGGAIPAPGP